MRIRPRPVAIVLLLWIAASARAADQKFHYLEPKSVFATHLLPPPPSVGSEEYKSEIDQILALQAARTPAQIERFRAEEKLGLSAFQGVMPSGCSADNLPKLNRLLEAAISDSKYFGGIAKNHFKRKRPYWEDSRVQPLGQREEEYAYPSGHATRAIIVAAILARLEPARADKLLERGREIGWDRVIGGVHHPSDIAAGRVLGKAVARALLKNAAFQADLEAAKSEYQDFQKSRARDRRSPCCRTEKEQRK